MPKPIVVPAIRNGLRQVVATMSLSRKAGIDHGHGGQRQLQEEPRVAVGPAVDEVDAAH
jgi:hypothetical protein